MSIRAILDDLPQGRPTEEIIAAFQSRIDQAFEFVEQRQMFAENVIFAGADLIYREGRFQVNYKSEFIEPPRFTAPGRAWQPLGFYDNFDLYYLYQHGPSPSEGEQFAYPGSVDIARLPASAKFNLEKEAILRARTLQLGPK
jgi:hypothetical protein